MATKKECRSNECGDNCSCVVISTPRICRIYRKKCCPPSNPYNPEQSVVNPPLYNFPLDATASLPVIGTSADTTNIFTGLMNLSDAGLATRIGINIMNIGSLTGSIYYDGTSGITGTTGVTGTIEGSAGVTGQDCCEKLTKLFQSTDQKIDDISDYMQSQLNQIKESYAEFYQQLQVENIRYQQIHTELDNLTNAFDTLMFNILHGLGAGATGATGATGGSGGCCSCNVIFTDTTQVILYPIKPTINVFYITMVAGGGAGGCGVINNSIYYSGGGGGSGSALIKRPVFTEGRDTVLRINVGAGGKMDAGGTTGACGNNTTVEILREGLPTILLTTYGGKCGHPFYRVYDDLTVDGGKGGTTELCCHLKGCDGKPGMITVPSQPIAGGGDGAGSILYKGGCGGGNIFANGGRGSSSEYNVLGNLLQNVDLNQAALIGEDGTLGSGGGGSIPRLTYNGQYSGNGGNGIVIVEW